MRTDIYTTELRDINEKFNNLETDVEAKLNWGVPDAKKRQDIVSEVNLLKIQITDPKNTGIGAEARQIIGRIEKLLGKRVTPLTPISYDRHGYADLADRMELQIIQMVESLSPEEKRLKSDLNSAVLKWNKDVQNLLLLSQREIDDMAQGHIDKALTEYNKLGNRAHTALGNDRFRFVPSIPKTQEVGKIGYAFSHAIQHFGMFQFVVLAGCILLDFGIMLIILLMPADAGSTSGSYGSTVRTNRHRGQTLIPTH